MPPVVVWTHRAERRLQTALIRATASHAGLGALLADLGARLAAAFPQEDAVVGLEVYLGYRSRADEHVLLVDVRGPGRPGTCIVKLGPEERLRQEQDAWDGCRPAGFRSDSVFMALEPRYWPDRPDRLAALVYQDAQAHIGADEAVWLETAALRAVRFGSPDLGTVLEAVRRLFDQLGQVLYGGARVEEPAGARVELNPSREGRRRLADAYPGWTDHADSPGPVAVRQQVSAAFPLEFVGYIDPVDYFRFLDEELAAETPPRQVLPRRLRGPAHGDLHGRNVLVGVTDNRAGTPAVFDYEKMSCDNLLGWDFVKLETELKVRALDLIPPRRERLAVFAERVAGFESRLAARTAEARDAGAWPGAPAADDPLARLEALVLGVRGLAAAHLGRWNRAHEWLHEYYFLLGCYGVSTVRFDNPTERERAAALVSAGVAAVQYELGRPGGGRIGGAP